jgi:hypothetical protein
MPAGTRRGISRFIVMAMLQAARAKRLGLSTDSAYSWGLNRAIFYAAVKRGFRGGAPGGSAGSGDSEVTSGTGATGLRAEEYALGDDVAYRDISQPKLYFIIGDAPQTEKDFERQIEARFGSPDRFARAWAEAEAIVAEAAPETVASRRGFYESVYKPRRDELARRWTEMIGGEPASRTNLPKRRG